MNIFLIIKLVLVGILIILSLKSVLFWVYLWQLKEYRLLRFRSDFGRLSKLLLFWLGTGGRKFRFPILTSRALVVIVGSVIILGIFWRMIFLVFPTPVVFGVLLIYFLAPFAVSLLVFLTFIINFLAKRVLLFRLAKKIERLNNLCIIGITGSFGKTSTKEFIATVLSQKFKVVKTPKNINTEIGVARFVLSEDFDGSAEVLVAEIGAYRRGEIKRVAGALKPDIAVITAVSEQHLDLFGSLENTMLAKYELAESLSEEGTAFFNEENKNTLILSEWFSGKKVLYKTLPEAKDASVPDLYYSNISAAVLIARQLGMSEEEIAKGVKLCRSEETMLKTYRHNSGALIIEDLYSSNPDGVKAALRILGESRTQKKIVIMPCLIELGNYAPKIHRQIGEMINKIGACGYITTDDFFDDIQVEAGDRVRLIKNQGQILEEIKGDLNSDYAVLLEGRLSDSLVSFFQNK